MYPEIPTRIKTLTAVYEEADVTSGYYRTVLTKEAATETASEVMKLATHIAEEEMLRDTAKELMDILSILLVDRDTESGVALARTVVNSRINTLYNEVSWDAAPRDVRSRSIRLIRDVAKIVAAL